MAATQKMYGLSDDVGKAINFDFYVHRLDACGVVRATAYRQIGGALIKHGFIHDQGSGYVHKEAISEQDTYAIIRGVLAQYPWAAWCFKHFTLTDYVERYKISTDTLITTLSAAYQANNPDKVAKVQGVPDSVVSSTELMQRAEPQEAQPKPSSQLANMIQNAPSASRQQAPAAAHVSKSENVND